MGREAVMDFTAKELIEKGWSDDKKYKVTTSDGKTCLYRVSPAEQYERKKREYEYIKMIDTMRNQAGEVLLWYDGMRNTVPKWYKRK